MLVGVEIGGTKLQVAVGHATGEVVAMERRDIVASEGAAGILRQIKSAIDLLRTRYPLEAVGVGFGGPILARQGIVQTSHQIHGWDQFPLVQWFADEVQLPAVLGNDCDVAALAEATLGAGRDVGSMLYITVGTGIGGGLVFRREVHGGDRPAAAEIGHLRPGLDCLDPHDTVESLAAGPAISRRLSSRIAQQADPSPAARQLMALCGGDLSRLTTRQIGEAAVAGNTLALEAYEQAAQVLGWAIAQVIALVAPERIVIGGGVSLAGEDVFYQPVRRATATYVFRPLANSYTIVAPELGEAVVTHGALVLAGKPR